jgi:hypothetical protein
MIGLCALNFVAGFCTLLSTVLLLLFTISLHNNNPLIVNTGDLQLATDLLWDCPASGASVICGPAASTSRCRCQGLAAKK